MSASLEVSSMNSVAQSWPGSGISGLYVRSSVSIASSLMSFSIRAISWIWKRIVRRFSNSSVTNSPTATRRRCLSWITSRRNSSRSRSYRAGR